VGDRCRIVPWMDPLVAYHAADLVVMPSRFEGYGLAGAEAMAAGCPLLRSRTGGFDAMVREGVTGFGCDTDEDDFVRVALDLLARPDRLRVARANAPGHARAHLSLRRQGERTVEAYREALASIGGRHSLRVVRYS
jgi:glycosyltransferase involved in cell wall biosynthesis